VAVFARSGGPLVAFVAVVARNGGPSVPLAARNSRRLVAQSRFCAGGRDWGATWREIRATKGADLLDARGPVGRLLDAHDPVGDHLAVELEHAERVERLGTALGR
jgi:hypothetical protein